MKIKNSWQYSKRYTTEARQIVEKHDLKQKLNMDLRKLKVYISSKYRRCAGRCFYDSNLIVLAKFLIERENESQIRDVLKHELAHFKYHNHNAKFQDLAISLNLSNEFYRGTNPP